MFNEVKELTKEQTELLKAPLPNEAIKQHPTKSYLSVINSVYVVERFNEVFGIGGWTIRHAVIESDTKMVVVHAVFEASKYGIRLEQFGGNDNADKGDAYKGACTDALTKIASYMGVGIDVWKDKYKNGNKQQQAVNTNPPADVVIKIISAPEGTTKEQFQKAYSQHLKQPYAPGLRSIVDAEVKRRGLK